MQMSPYETGCRINLTDYFELSIQTDPLIVGNSFAETALISTEKKNRIWSWCLR